MSEATKPAAVATPVVESEIIHATEVQMECGAEAEVIVSDDAAMSVGDSDEEDESDGFSRTGSSSHGDSIPSRGSCKRPADGSPEREVTETIRKEFPGLVSRSEAGCRIYIPAPERAGAMEVISKLMTATTAVKNLGVMGMTDAMNITDLENVLCDEGAGDTAETKEEGFAIDASQCATNRETTATAATFEPTDIVTDEEMVIAAESTRVSTGIISGDIVSLPNLGKVGAPIPSASVICSVTMSESRASESGRESNGRGETGEPPLAAEGWACDAQMVEGIFRIMEGMEPPWITLDVLEAATVQFPTIDREMLRRTIMTVMMTQRRCVV